MTESFTDVEPVGSSRKRVQAQDNVHTVLLDGVVGDRSQVLLLVTVVQHGPGNIDPSGVGSSDSKRVDADRGESVDVGGGDKSCVVVFQNLSTCLLSDSLAESPLVRNTWGATVSEKVGSQSVLNSQPGPCD